MNPHDPHQHPEEQFVLINQDSGEILVDGATYRVGPGSMMYCADSRTHRITNTGSEKMLFYVWKWMAS
jgi:quercetin dioxygenase-like cupin family protein